MRPSLSKLILGYRHIQKSGFFGIFHFRACFLLPVAACSLGLPVRLDCLIINVALSSVNVGHDYEILLASSGSRVCSRRNRTHVRRQTLRSAATNP